LSKGGVHDNELRVDRTQLENGCLTSNWARHAQ